MNKNTPFGWKGFRPDPEKQTTNVVLIGMVNYALLIFALDQLFTRNELGRVVAIEDGQSTLFYILSIATILTALVSCFVIHYKEISARHSARLLVCGIPGVSALIMLFNTF